MSKLFKTFKSSVIDYMKDQLIHKVEIKAALMAYASWLDGFQVVSKDWEIIALQRARQSDRELISLLIDAVGFGKAQEIALKVSAKHRHHSQWQDQQKAEGVRNSRIVGRLIKMKSLSLAWITWQIGKVWPTARTLGLTTPTSDLPANMKRDLENLKNNK